MGLSISLDFSPNGDLLPARCGCGATAADDSMVEILSAVALMSLDLGANKLSGAGWATQYARLTFYSNGKLSNTF